MSVTIADLLRLPSLREAKVLAGDGGLNRIVSSVSVLEYADPGLLNDNLFNNNEFFGSEIVITGFVNIKDDVDKQCATLRRLAEAGEAGLVLYYVGVFVQEVDKRLIELADELNFALICMPENRFDLRYSEVICETMEAIIKDQMLEPMMVSEILERVSRLPPHQRTVNTVLKMVSDRIHASLVLTDAAGRILNEACWPRTLSGEGLMRLKKAGQPEAAGKSVEYAQNGRVYRYAINTDRMQSMELYIFREGDELQAEIIKQTMEVVQLAVNLWSRQHDEIVLSELVSAILQDEPIKMRRLAEIFHIDVASLNTMWILRFKGFPREQHSQQDATAASNLLRHSCKTVVLDRFQGDLIAFTSGVGTMLEIEELSDNLLNQFLEAGADVTLTFSNNLRTTSDVRRAYMMNNRFLGDAMRVFPLLKKFDLQIVGFVRQCRELVERGESEMEDILSALHPLEAERETEELNRTLQVFLLDAEGSVAQAAKLLFLHKNTVKYRLARMSERLGYRIGKMPESALLYQAAAIKRLLD